MIVYIPLCIVTPDIDGDIQGTTIATGGGGSARRARYVTWRPSARSKPRYQPSLPRLRSSDSARISMTPRMGVCPCFVSLIAFAYRHQRGRVAETCAGVCPAEAIAGCQGPLLSITVRRWSSEHRYLYRSPLALFA